MKRKQSGEKSAIGAGKGWSAMIDIEANARALAEAKGYIYWGGGQAPPVDWDGGPYLCRDGDEYIMRGYDWAHGTGCWNETADWDRIGYRTIGKKIS